MTPSAADIALCEQVLADYRTEATLLHNFHNLRLSEGNAFIQRIAETDHPAVAGLPVPIDAVLLDHAIRETLLNLFHQMPQNPIAVAPTLLLPSLCGQWGMSVSEYALVVLSQPVVLTSTAVRKLAKTLTATLIAWYRREEAQYRTGPIALYLPVAGVKVRVTPVGPAIEAIISRYLVPPADPPANQ